MTFSCGTYSLAFVSLNCRVHDSFWGEEPLENLQKIPPNVSFQKNGSRFWLARNRGILWNWDLKLAITQKVYLFSSFTYVTSTDAFFCLKSFLTKSNLYMEWMGKSIWSEWMARSKSPRQAESDERRGTCMLRTHHGLTSGGMFIFGGCLVADGPFLYHSKSNEVEPSRITVGGESRH